MTEEEFLERWYRERPIVEAWGKFVTQKLMEQIAPLVAPVKADIFIRIPATPRLKQDGSLISRWSLPYPRYYIDARELQRLEICKSPRSPIQVLARSASALRADVVLPRRLYSSASP